MPYLKNNDKEQRIYMANKQDFEMKLISQIYDDLFQSCGSLVNDLFA